MGLEVIQGHWKLQHSINRLRSSIVTMGIASIVSKIKRDICWKLRFYTPFYITIPSGNSCEYFRAVFPQPSQIADLQVAHIDSAKVIRLLTAQGRQTDRQTDGKAISIAERTIRNVRYKSSRLKTPDDCVMSTQVACTDVYAKNLVRSWTEFSLLSSLRNGYGLSSSAIT